MRKTIAGPLAPGSHGGLTITLVCLLLAVIGSVIILSWVPPVSRDALSHHLAVPKRYLQQGEIYEIPEVRFSYYPMNLDLLYMIPLYFGNDILPKYIHFAFALLTAGLIFSYLRKRLDAVWAGGGALFFLSLPVIVKLSINVYVDLGLVFFSTAALMALLKWIESRWQSKHLILSAVCCGLALGTKYNGLIVLLILTAFVPLLYDRHPVVHAADGHNGGCAKRPFARQLRAAGSGTLFCLIAVVVFSPWMVRNYLWKDNPVYPLYDRFFNTAPVREPATEPDDENIRTSERQSDSAHWGSFAVRKVVYQETWWEIALIPVRIFFQGQDDNPKYFDGQLNPFLFLLPFFAFRRSKENSEGVSREKKILLSFSILFMLYAYLQTDMRIRYIAPIIPPLVILSTLGLNYLHRCWPCRWPDRMQRPFQCGVLLLASVALLLNAAYIFHQFKEVDPISYISGRVGRDAYITRYRPEYTIMQYANRHLPADAKLLGLFMGNRSYYSDRDLIFGINLFRKMVKRVDSAPAIVKDLQQKGFTHLMIRYDLFNGWTDKQFSDREKKMLKEFFDRDARHVLSSNGYGLFALPRNQEASQK